MKILLGWILFTSLLSMAIVFKAPDFLPIGERSGAMISQSSQLQLLDELISQDEIDSKKLQERQLALKLRYKNSVANAQLETLPITSLFFALVGLNILNIVLILVFLLFMRKKKDM